MVMNKDLIIRELEDMNKRKDRIIEQMLEETETLASLVGEVKTTLKDFKRRKAGNQITSLFKRLEMTKGIDPLKAKGDIMKYVTNQRTSRAGLFRVVRKYMKKNNYQMPDNFELEHYTEHTFEAITQNAQQDANMALSVLASMLVVLLDVEENRLKEDEAAATPTHG